MKSITQSVLTLSVITLLCFAAPTATAQEKMKYSFSGKPESVKYGQQHVLDVGDVPGHQLRIAELDTKYGADAPEYAGVKIVQVKGRLMSDYIDGSGRLVGYGVLYMANGDRIYTRSETTALSAPSADGSRKASFITISTITGGTGKFATIRGVLRGTGFTDFKTGTSGTQTEGEYWFEK